MRPTNHGYPSLQTHTALPGTEAGTEARTEHTAEHRTGSTPDASTAPAGAPQAADAPRMKTVARPPSPDPMQLDTVDPSGEGPLGPSRKRKANERDGATDLSSSSEAEVDSKPQLKCRRTDGGSAASGGASTGRRPWHARVCFAAGSDSDEVAKQCLRAMRSGATRDMLYALVFGTKENWPQIDITFKSFPASSAPPPDLLRSCGALVASGLEDEDILCDAEERVLVICGSDFDTARFRHHLSQAANDAESLQNPTTAQRTSLNFAAAWGDPELLATQIKEGGNVNACDDTGRFPLAVATLEGNGSIVQQLLVNGANTDALNPFNWTALSIAAFTGRADLCEMLLANNAPLRRCKGRHPLREAAWLGHIDVCRVLLHRDPGIVNDAHEESGCTALIYAASAGNCALCELLLDHGANVHAIARNGWSVLSHAAAAGNLDLFRQLVAMGAKPDDPACEITPLMTAAVKGNTAMIELLISLKVDLEYRDENGLTALLLASEKGHRDTVALLLQHGAQLLVSDDDGHDALFHAALNGHTNVLDVLLEKINPATLNLGPGYRALEGAVRQLQIEAARRLLQEGVVIRRDLMPQGEQVEQTLLIDALDADIIPGATEHRICMMLELLLSWGAPTDPLDDYGEDALMRAVHQSNYPATQLLLTHGASIGQRSFDYGMDALQIAVLQLERKLWNGKFAGNALLILAQLLAHHTRIPVRDPVSSVIIDYFDLATHPVTLEILSLEKQIGTQGMELTISGKVTGPGYTEHIRNELLRLWKSDLGTIDKTRLPTFLISIGIPPHLTAHFSTYLCSMAELRPVLTSPQPEHGEACFGSWLASIFASSADTLATQPMTSGPTTPLQLGEDVTKTFDALARSKTQALVEAGLAAERATLGVTIAGLFDTLLTLGRPSRPMTPGKQGAVFDQLCEAGMYAPLARGVAEAWESALSLLPPAIPASAQTSESADGPAHNTMSLDVSLEDFDIDGSGTEEEFERAANANAPVPSQPWPDDSHGAWKDQLLQDFRLALRRALSVEGSIRIVRHSQLTSEAASVYADLMFRQLHMLSQFIEPEKFAQSAE